MGNACRGLRTAWKKHFIENYRGFTGSVSQKDTAASIKQKAKVQLLEDLPEIFLPGDEHSDSDDMELTVTFFDPRPNKRQVVSKRNKKLFKKKQTTRPKTFFFVKYEISEPDFDEMEWFSIDHEQAKYHEPNLDNPPKSVLELDPTRFQRNTISILLLLTL